MRCPECMYENEEGAAFCASCATPLTAYGGQLTGEVNARTLEKARQLALRPVAVAPMVVLNILIALAGPFNTVVHAFGARPSTGSEGTNYVGAAFGAVGVFFTALFLVPLGVALLIVAWGVWTQKSWAWLANLIVWGAIGVMALLGFWPHGIVGRLIVLVIAALAIAAWSRRETREWYGAV